LIGFLVRQPFRHVGENDLPNALLLFGPRRRGSGARGFQNGIVLDALGNVAETCSSNIFLAKNGTVSTPVPNGSFLAGITRSSQ